MKPKVVFIKRIRMILIYKLWEYLMEIRDENVRRMILIPMQILMNYVFIREFYMHRNFI